MRKVSLTLCVFIVIQLVAGVGFAASKARLKWQAVPLAGGYLMEIKNENGAVIFSKFTEQAYIDFKLSFGRYEGRISVLNKFKKVSVSSRWFPIVIKQSVIPIFKNISQARFSHTDNNAKSIIAGDDFLPGITVYLRKGAKRHLVKRVNYISKEKISIFLRSSQLKPGYYDLVLQNPGGLKAVKNELVFISKQDAGSSFFKPVFKYISASVFYPNQGKTTIEITGNNFQEGCNVYVQRDASLIKLGKVEYISDSKISVELNTFVLSKGNYDLILENPGDVREIIKNRIQVISVIKILSSDGEFYDKVHVQWTKGVSSDSYYVYRAVSKTGEYNKIAETTTNYYDDKNVTPGTIYFYKVRPWSKIGNEGPFSTVDPGFSKKQVTGIVVKDYIGKLEVSWNSFPGASNYTLYRSTASDSGFEKLNDSYTLGFADITIKTDQKYYYKVKANTKSGESFDSMPLMGYSSKTKTGLYLRGLLPGLGQFYLHKDLKGSLLLGAFAASAGFFGWSYYDMNQKQKAYANLDYGLSKSEYDKKYKAYTQSTSVMIGAACLVAAVYIANWVDVLMFNADALPPWDKTSSAAYNSPQTQLTFDVKPDLLRENVSKTNSFIYSMGVSYSY